MRKLIIFPMIVAILCGILVTIESGVGQDSYYLFEEALSAISDSLSSATWTSDITLGSGDLITMPPSGTLTNLQFTGTVVVITAGFGTTAIGDLVYYNDDDDKLELADSDGAATSADVMVGVVVTAVAEDASCTILLDGVITVDAWNWAAGSVGQSLWISETAGDFEETLANISDTNDIVRPVAWVIDDDTIYFHGGAAYATVE